MSTILAARSATPPRFIGRLADYSLLALGLLLMAAPFLFGYTEATVAQNASLAGGAAVGLAAAMSLIGWYRTGRILAAIAGLALMAGPYVLSLYIHDAVTLLLYTVGMAAIALAMVTRSRTGD